MKGLNIFMLFTFMEKLQSLSTVSFLALPNIIGGSTLTDMTGTGKRRAIMRHIFQYLSGAR
jgi:hypothetical protein